LLIALLTLVSLPATAAITVLDYYRLGDADSGSIPGHVGNGTTTDSARASNLTRNGSPTYSSNVPFSSIAGASDSFSMAFNGASPGDYTFSTRLTDAQDNFGLEAFVAASSTTGDVGIVYNGKAGSSGFGLLRRGNLYQAELGTNPGTIFGSASVTAGTWVHLALVRDNGVSTFYVNGIASGTSSATPLFGSDPFRIGSSVGNDNFAGLIDEVRLFTFTPGSFTTNDLLVNPVPEVSTAGVILVGMIALLSTKRLTN
jgi:hypothetical protein